MSKYRVLVGHHEEVVTPENTSQGVKEKRVIYGQGCAAGDVFESRVDMLRQNAPGMSPKFALVENDRGPESEAELERRIREDQKKLDAIRTYKTTPAPLPTGTHPVENVVTAPPPGAEPTKPNPHVAPKAETDLVRQRQLQSMSVKQLQDIAAEEEIDCSSCKSKEDYIKAILAK